MVRHLKVYNTGFNASRLGETNRVDNYYKNQNHGFPITMMGGGLFGDASKWIKNCARDAKSAFSQGRQKTRDAIGNIRSQVGKIGSHVGKYAGKDIGSAVQRTIDGKTKDHFDKAENFTGVPFRFRS